MRLNHPVYLYPLGFCLKTFDELPRLFAWHEFIYNENGLF